MSDTTAVTWPHLCATMDVHRRLLAADPGYRRAQAALEERTSAWGPAHRMATVGVVDVAVVVHVVADADERDVSDEQVASQLAVLNQDFRARNPDVAGVPEPWRPLVGDARVQFHLAATGPDGSPTTGIVRRRTSVAEFVADDSVKAAASGGSDPWPADRYLNLWVCPLAGGLLGYAQFPGGPPETDGVVVDYRAFGTTGTASAPFDLGRTATHEVGHWLNLRHIWGDDGAGCSGTDLVDDTPNQGGANTGRPTFPSVSCDNGPHGDMFVNFMDYTDDAAMFMFTAGQVERMRAALDGPRASLARAEAPPSGDPSAVPGPPEVPGAGDPPPGDGTGAAGEGAGAGHVPDGGGLPGDRPGADAGAGPPGGAGGVGAGEGAAAGPPDDLFQRWYLSLEESSAGEDVYRPAGFPLPRSRAPRPGLELWPDGTYVEYRPGPADAPVPVEGQWSSAGESRVEARVPGSDRLRCITVEGPDRLCLRPDSFADP